MSLPTYITGMTQTKAYQVLRVHVYKVLSQYDLTVGYWSMLGIIAQARDGVRQVEIARALGVKAPLVTIMTRELVNQQLVTSVPNQFDGRAKLLALTPAGKKFVKQVETELNHEISLLLNGLTMEDMTTYQKVLQTIINNDENLSKTA